MALINISQKLSAKEKEPTRSFSKRQENAIAKTLNGSRTKNSGATTFQKGDVLLEQFLIEAKTKTSASESISIKKEWLEKNKKEALFMGKEYNALAFNFGPNQPNYYIIDEALFADLVDMLNSKDNE